MLAPWQGPLAAAELALRTDTPGPGCCDWLRWLAAVFGAASLQALLPSDLAQQLLLLQLEGHWRAWKPPMLCWMHEMRCERCHPPLPHHRPRPEGWRPSIAKQLLLL